MGLFSLIHLWSDQWASNSGVDYIAVSMKLELGTGSISDGENYNVNEYLPAKIYISSEMFLNIHS